MVINAARDAAKRVGPALQNNDQPSSLKTTRNTEKLHREHLKTPPFFDA